MKFVTDVVVVGAGMVGCSTAFHLARAKGVRVVVVEKGAIGSGMTKRSGALIRTHYADSAEAQLALASLGFFQNWKETVGGECGFVQTGLITVVRGPTNAARLEKNVTLLRSLGVSIQLLSREELHALQPFAQVDDVDLASYEPESGYADPMAATRSLAERSRDLGVIFKTGTLVRSIRIDQGRVMGVDTNAGPIETLNVVVAAGAWSDRLLSPLGLAIGILPERAQIAYFERPPDFKASHTAYLDTITGALFRPHSYGLTLGTFLPTSRQNGRLTTTGQAGSAGEDQETHPSNPDQFEQNVDADFVADIKDRIAGRLPAMAAAKLVRGHAGILDASPDGHAVLDRVPGLPGLFVAAGFGGTGFALAPAVGACIGEMVTDGVARSIDVREFRLARFKGNTAIASATDYA